MCVIVYPECDLGGDYLGSKHVTKSGLECRHWNELTSDQSNSLMSLNADFNILDENYCRYSMHSSY